MTADLAPQIAIDAAPYPKEGCCLSATSVQATRRTHTGQAAHRPRRASGLVPSVACTASPARAVAFAWGCYHPHAARTTDRAPR